MQSIYTNPEEKLWFVARQYPKEAMKSKGLKIEKGMIIRMGRIRLRVRDIDYPDPKEDAKSVKSLSPRSARSRGAKTNISSKGKHSDSEIENGEFDLDNQVQVKFENLEHTVGVDGGIELIQNPKDDKYDV